MKVRILGAGIVSVAVLGLALAALLRPDARPREEAAPPAVASPTGTAPVQPPAKPDWSARPLSSFRVYETETPEGLDVRGAGYTAQVTSSGLDFKAKDFSVAMRAARVEQGGRSIELGGGLADHPAFAHARITHPVMTEEYLFENNRAEQVFRIPSPLGQGALKIHVSVESTLGGPVIDETSRAGWKEAPLWEGGLVFCNASGESKLAYHGAVAIDARGRRCPLYPRYEGGQITLEVPASFMAEASFPLLVDPWLELNMSASGGGVSNTAAVSQTPVLAVEGGGNPYVVWAEEVNGNFEIYLRYWNGFSWFALGGSDQAGGISSNSGNSTNPAIALVPTGEVFVAWQDDTSGNLEIYLKKWNGSSWVELKNSGSGGGISNSIGESTRPSVDYMMVSVPSTNVGHIVPVVAWQDTVTGPTSIHLAVYFPGDPGQAYDPTTGAPNYPVILERWYGLGNSLDYQAVGGLSATPGGYVSEQPRLAVRGTFFAGRTASLVWQDTRGNNYEIYFSQNNIPNDSSDPDPNMPVYPAVKNPWFTTGNWTPPVNVSNTAPMTLGPTATGLSINPALALDSMGNACIAWEESLSPTNSEIFAAYPNGSAIGSVLNVSNTAAASTTPSIAVATDGTVYVAWSDAEPGNSEIYIKRSYLGGAWLSVGNDPSFGISSTGMGGISRTFGASLFPVVKAGASPVVVWQDFSNGKFEIYLRRYFQNEPRALRQTFYMGTPPVLSELVFGGTTTVQTVQLCGTLFSESTARWVRLQVEVRPIDSEFVGTVTAQSDLYPVNPLTHLTSEVAVNFTGLVNTSYHWRARVVDDIGQASAWVSAGSNADGAPDFTVSAIPPVPPNPPVNLMAQANGLSVQLSWQAPQGSESLTYKVYRDTQWPFGSTMTVQGSKIAETTFVDSTNVSPNTTYFYAVTATDIAGQESALSTPASATTPAPPALAPTNVQALGGYNEITITWNGVQGATSYVVRTDTSASGSFATVVASGLISTTCTHTGLPNSATRYYRVAAQNDAGIGPYSATVSATTLAPTAPSAPTGLTATGGDGQISLAWSPSSGTPPFTYNVKRSTVNGGPYQVIATGISTTSFDDVGLPPVTTYFYVVSAVNGLGESANSIQASATTNPLTGIPPAPTGLTATPASATTVVLSWTAVTGAGSVVYNVRRATTSGGPYTTIATGLTGATYTSAGLTTGTTYYYVVTSQNGAGESGYSNEASATPTATIVNPPTGLSAAAGDRSVILSWAPMSGATSYNVKRATVSGGPYTTIANVTGTSYTDTGLTHGVAYYYVVSAMMGALESANSSEASAVPTLGTPDDDDNHCGLLGIEVLALLGLLRIFRRR